ncbi:MAG: hypothetical protein SFX18_19240 [Pirellulales bacterium]|nr:hypothetical protein [Pirellulales bacterium]
MRDRFSWTILLGTWRGIHFRLHVTTVLFWLFAWQVAQLADPARGATLWCVGFLTWVLALAAHELGHVYALVHFGGKLQDYVCTPLGNMAAPRLSQEPQAEFSYALAGPGMNFILGLAAAILLAWQGINCLDLVLSPFLPQGVQEGPLGLVAMKLWCWWNGLFLLNLFPALPLDGGRALVAVLWPVFSRRGTILIVTRSMMLTSAGLVVLSCLLPLIELWYLPGWLAMMCLATWLLFAAFADWSSGSWIADEGRDRRWDHDNHHESELFPWIDDQPRKARGVIEQDIEPRPQPFAKNRRTTKPFPPEDVLDGDPPMDEELADAADWLEDGEPEEFTYPPEGSTEWHAPPLPTEEERLDEILSRVKLAGLSSLSRRDREFLEQASQKLRARARPRH